MQHANMSQQAGFEHRMAKPPKKRAATEGPTHQPFCTRGTFSDVGNGNVAASARTTARLYCRMLPSAAASAEDRVPVRICCSSAVTCGEPEPYRPIAMRRDDVSSAVSPGT